MQVSDVTMQETLRDESSKMRRQARLGHPSSQGKPMPTIVPYTDLLNTYTCIPVTNLGTVHMYRIHIQVQLQNKASRIAIWVQYTLCANLRRAAAAAARGVDLDRIRTRVMDDKQRYLFE